MSATRKGKKQHIFFFVVVFKCTGFEFQILNLRVDLTRKMENVVVYVEVRMLMLIIQT